MPGMSLRTETLDNGLTVFLREQRTAPVASFWVWYRVGSRNETPGLTGLSHWVEHMQFKGTPTLAKGAIFGEVSRNGGSLNAMTSQDWTAYFETLPADRLDLSLRIEADRMRNSLFDPDETERERTVILSERQGGENRPTYLLAEEVIGTAFQAHPYRHMVIGYENDLKRISRDDLYNHYRRYYAPNNAYITAVGDFDADKLLGRIEAAFGGIEPGEAPPSVAVAEPPQRGERAVTLRRSSPAAYLFLGYRMPDARHPDTPAILVADALLSGAKPMGFGGGSANNRSARLYRSLVTAGLARSVSSSADLNLDPHLWTFSATALPGVEPGRIQDALDAEIDRLGGDLAPEDEFQKARTQIRAQYVYARETVTSQAFWLGQMESVDHAARVDTLADELAAVTPEDVRRVARKWLVRDQRTVGWQLPVDGDAAGADVEDAVPSPSVTERDPQRVWWLGPHPRAARHPSPNPGRGVSGELVLPLAPAEESRLGGEGSPSSFERTTLPNGMVVLTQARPESETVSGTIRIAAGHGSTGEERAGLAALTGRMLNRGTAARSFDEFNEAIDRRGASVGIDTSRDDVSVSFHCLEEDVDAVLGMVAEFIQGPTFPEDELERVRQQTLTSIREQDNDTRTVASRALRELLYPEGHPYRQRITGEIETVSAFTREDLAGYHRRFFGPATTTVAMVGAFRDLDAATELIQRHLGAWSVDVPPVQTPDAGSAPEHTARKTLGVPGKSQSDLAAAFPTIPRSHPDYYALNVANVILGQIGLMGRLGADVRDDQGLAYYVYSRLNAGTVGSTWQASAGVDPANVERALEAITAQLRRLRTEPVTADELADAKSYLTGSLPVGLESPGAVVQLLLTIEEFDLGLDYLDRYPQIINALTVEALQAAALTHLDPDRLAVGIAGPE